MRWPESTTGGLDSGRLKRLASGRLNGMTLEDILTLSDGLSGRGGAASVVVATAILDHHFDHHWPLSGAVR
jgi:hypothetical protein